MSRNGLLIACVLLAPLAEDAAAVDQSPSSLKDRWAKAVEQRAPVIVKFRWRQRDRVFEKESVAYGEFFHDGTDRWALRLNSSIGDENHQSLPSVDRWGKPPALYPRHVVICDAESGLICLGNSERCENCPLNPVSAVEPENVPLSAFQEFTRNWSRAITSQLEFQRQMPLLLPRSGDFANHRATVEERNDGDIRLTLTPDPHAFSATDYYQIDVVFHANAALPYAIRVTDRDLRGEQRFLLDEIRIGNHVKIPNEAFQPPRTTDH